MKIETERTALRKPTLKDVQDLIESGNDYDVHYNSFFLMKYPFEEKEAIEVIEEKKKNMERFVIELKKEKKVIGIFDIYNINLKDGKIKIGYWIGKKYRRQGYAEEVLKNMIKFIFENFSVNKIIATTLINNEPSMKLLEKVGFRKDKILKNDRFLEGKYVDSVQFVFLNKQA